MSGPWAWQSYSTLNADEARTLALSRRADWGYHPLDGHPRVRRSTTDTSAAARRAVSACDRESL